MTPSADKITKAALEMRKKSSVPGEEEMRKPSGVQKMPNRTGDGSTPSNADIQLPPSALKVNHKQLDQKIKGKLKIAK